MDKKVVKEHLIKAFCYKCGASLDGADVVPIADMHIFTTAHVTCRNCQAESMLTITPNGGGVLPIATDLTPEEIKTVFSKDPISSDEVINVHKALKKEKIWNLLQQKEVSLEKNPKN